MTQRELENYLWQHRDYKVCPHCGGAGEFILPVNAKVFECQVCRGAGVVKDPPISKEKV